MLIFLFKKTDDQLSEPMPASSTNQPTSISNPSHPESSTVTLDSMKGQLATLLGVPLHLVGAGDVSLCKAYQKYKAFLAAVHTADQLVSKGTLNKKPTQGDIMSLFASKSFFHSHYKKFFPKVSNYPDMVAWLEEQPDCLDSVDVWGLAKDAYNFGDLQNWLANGGTLELYDDSEDERDAKMGKKGKGKEKEKEKKKKEKKKGKVTLTDRDVHKEKKKKKDGRRAQ
jgi:hypothetical protein